MVLFFQFIFLSCDYPLQRGGWHLCASAESGYKKKIKIITSDLGLRYNS